MPPPDPARLRRIVLAYTANELGRWFALVALSLVVYERTHSAPAIASVFIVPSLTALLAPVLVARVEASPRRGGISLLYAVEALSASAIAVLLWRFSLPGILVLVAVDGATSYAARGLLRSEAARGAGGHGEPSAHAANATLNASLALTGVAGPALAGVAVTQLGGPAALAIDAACLICCAALVADLRPYVQEHEGSVRARLRAARAHLRAAPDLRTMLSAEALALLFFTCALPLEVLYAKSSLRAGDAGYGALLAVWGVGMVAGSLLFARLGGDPRPASGAGAEAGAEAGADGGVDSRGLGPEAAPIPAASVPARLSGLLVGGALAVGLSYLGLASAPGIRLAALAALVGGIGNGVQWAALIGAVQRLTPVELLGRMMATVETMGAIAPALGYALGGALGALSEPRIALMAAGLGACASAAWLLRAAIGASAARGPLAVTMALAGHGPTEQVTPGLSANSLE